MSSQPINHINLAFFGVTGGCANACLTHTLKNGYKASALARTPSKLQSQLISQGLDKETLDNNLTIIQGDATDVEAVKRTLSPAANHGKIVSTIISGLGGAPKFQTSLTQPITIDNPNITEQATRATLAAIEALLQQSSVAGEEQQKPLYVVISTTGISAGPNDVPLTLRPIYYFLELPHADKRRMEQMLFESADDSVRQVIRGAIAVRPTLLVGDHLISNGNGWKTLRVGTEKKPAMGHAIKRVDVGEWIFEEIVRRGGEKWVGEKVTLTS
ncbi:hypothetical protein AJ79_09725 [Helicocarpus griseus UAMH5409]|uniref:NAD(P)-binding domain-containing protein n=1 Tax=Helicocarpus griseus UAMH5409 TaxID=1447875 RepID=A0A2B7WHP6_9EURO|nr:hypothetical protein AJ79_09725 [Helicocarpus griseus UAMH5409]